MNQILITGMVMVIVYSIQENMMMKIKKPTNYINFQMKEWTKEEKNVEKKN